MVMRTKRGDKEEEAYLDEDGRERSGRFVLREESRKRGRAEKQLQGRRSNFYTHKNRYKRRWDKNVSKQVSS